MSSTSPGYSADGTFSAQLTTTTAAFTRVTRASTGKMTAAATGIKGAGYVVTGGAADEWVGVRSHSSPGQQVGIAAGTIAVGDAVYTAAAGLIDAVSTNEILLGHAATAGTVGARITYDPSN